MLFSFRLNAQIVQHGIVKEYQESMSKTPLAGVDIVVLNAGTTFSDKDGNFSLKFRTQKIGDRVQYRRIEKLNYEIFNKEALDQWYISSHEKPFVVVMCESSKFKRIRDHYNEIASVSYSKQLKKEVQKLKQDLETGEIQEEEYRHKLKDIQLYYEEQLENIDTYLDRFTRIDLSELSKDEQEVIRKVNIGDIDSAIEFYEKKDFLSAFHKECNDIKELKHTKNVLLEAKEEKNKQRDSIYASILRQIDTYMLAGGKANIDKAQKMLKECALSDTTNIDVVFNYANFATKQKNYEDAEFFYEICLNNTQDYEIRGRIYFNLGIIYAQTNRFLKAEVAMLEALVKEELRESLMPERYKGNMALVQQNIGSLYQLMNDDNKALLYLSAASETYKQIYDNKPQTCIENYAQTLMNLGIVFRKLQKDSDSELSYKKAINLYTLLADSVPSKHLANLAICQMNLGYMYYYSHNNQKSKETFVTALQNMNTVLARNPYSLQAELGSLYNGLGLLYHAENNKAKSIEYYLKALNVYKELCKSSYETHKYTYARILANLGSLYAELENNDKALKMLKESYDILENAPKDVYDAFKIDIAKVSYLLGNNIMSSSLYDAEEYFLKAHEILTNDKLGNIDTGLLYILIDARIKLGIIYMDNNVEESERYYKLVLPQIKDYFMTSPDEYRVSYATVLLGLVKSYQAMLTTCEDAYNNLIKYLPSAYKQYKILYSQNPDEFRDFYEYAKELMSSLNLQY